MLFCVYYWYIVYFEFYVLIFLYTAKIINNTIQSWLTILIIIAINEINDNFYVFDNFILIYIEHYVYTFCVVLIPVYFDIPWYIIAPIESKNDRDESIRNDINEYFNCYRFNILLNLLIIIFLGFLFRINYKFVIREFFVGKYFYCWKQEEIIEFVREFLWKFVFYNIMF